MSQSARGLASEERAKLPTRLELPAVDAASEREKLEALVGRRIGNYVVERLLGRGGMAVVYVAKHPALGREVAVKLLSPEYQSEEDLNRRFLQEARVMAGLHHPNVVEIYDLGVVDGRAYYTMERLSGKDLAATLQERGPFGVREAVAYLSQIATALDVAHRFGIVHRDLKPANVFVVQEQPPLLKLMDFGIAKVSDARRSTGTVRGEVLGTPAYMAPEQALGNIDSISARTDLYALGIIAHEMLTGKLPFVADSDLLLLTMHVRDTPERLSELAPHVPPELGALFDRCLAKDPEDRPRSAAELCEALSRFRDSADSPAVAEAPPAPAPAGDSAPAQLPPALLLSEITDDPPSLPGAPVTLSSQEGRVFDRLLRRMQRRADFPSFLNNVTEISRKADADADYSAFQLSESILKDYALTAKLLRMVNSLYANRFGGKVFSVNQAVLILGFDSVRSMALGVSVYRLTGQAAANAQGTRAGRFHEQLAEDAINSLISGEIARTLAPRAGVESVELAMMCAMFRNLGQQLVMEYLPEDYEKLLELERAERISRAAAAQRVLGTTLPKLGTGIAERWCLPRLMRAAMASHPRPDAPLVREEDRLAALAKLSNDLCYVIAGGDRRDYKPALLRLLAMHKNLLSFDEKEVGALLGTVCKSFEMRYASLYGPYHRKCRFLFNARGIAGEPVPEAPPRAGPPSEDEARACAHATQALAEKLANRHAPDALLAGGLEALSKALAAPRVLLLTQTSDRKELEVRAALGEDAKALKAQLRVALAHGSDFFTIALRSGKNVTVPDALAPAAMRRLPQRYFESIGSPALGLYVCQSRGYPTALLLVDAEGAEYLPCQERVSLTKALRELTAKIAERS